MSVQDGLDASSESSTGTERESEARSWGNDVPANEDSVEKADPGEARVVLTEKEKETKKKEKKKCEQSAGRRSKLE